MPGMWERSRKVRSVKCEKFKRKQIGNKIQNYVRL